MENDGVHYVFRAKVTAIMMSVFVLRLKITSLFKTNERYILPLGSLIHQCMGKEKILKFGRRI